MKYAALMLIIAIAVQAEVTAGGPRPSLPIGFTEEELTRLDEIGINTVPTSPPPEGTINPGEWDPATGVFINWSYYGLPDDLIVDFSNVTTVWVVCESGEQSSAASHFSSAGVNMSNVDYLIAETNSMWVRDYGPWFLLLEDGTQGIFNYTYNRPRPQDNLFPEEVGSTWGIPVYTSTIEHTGGNYMSSGYDQAMSTELVYTENGGNEDWVDSQMELYLGIDNYVTMEDPQGSYIDHIDCWAKMLSPGKLLVLQVPPSHPDYAALEAAADMLEATESPYGVNWEVFRVQSSGTEGYTNSLICNDHVYVPLWGTSYDAAALDAYDSAMDGYAIHGYEYGGWESTDALHCRTRNVMDNEMLYIMHVPVDTLQTAESPVVVDALIRCHPDNSLSSCDVNYRIGTSGGFTALSMTSTGNDSFTVNIPGVTAGETVQYYISATDDSGRNEARPRFAPETWFFEYETSATGVGHGGMPAVDITMETAQPNPFSSFVSIGYTVSEAVPMSFVVCDISGRVVHRSGGVLEPGSSTFSWTPEQNVPCGIYLIRLECPDWNSTQKVTFVR